MKRYIRSSGEILKPYLVTYGYDSGDIENGPIPEYGYDIVYALSEDEACYKWQADNGWQFDDVNYTGCYAREATPQEVAEYKQYMTDMEDASEKLEADNFDQDKQVESKPVAQVGPRSLVSGMHVRDVTDGKEGVVRSSDRGNKYYHVVFEDGTSGNYDQWDKFEVIESTDDVKSSLDAGSDNWGKLKQYIDLLPEYGDSSWVTSSLDYPGGCVCFWYEPGDTSYRLVVMDNKDYNEETGVYDHPVYWGDEELAETWNDVKLTADQLYDEIRKFDVNFSTWYGVSDLFRDHPELRIRRRSSR